LSSTRVALVLMPGAAAILIAGMAGGRLITLIGARRQAIVGNAFVIASFLGFVLLLPRTAAGLACDLIPLGIGIGLSTGAVINLALRDSTTQEAAVTASLNSAVRTVGQALGPQVAIAVAAPVLAPASRARTASTMRSCSASSPPSAPSWSRGSFLRLAMTRCSRRTRPRAKPTRRPAKAANWRRHARRSLVHRWTSRPTPALKARPVRASDRAGLSTIAHRA
jgi:MFS family permease